MNVWSIYDAINLLHKVILAAGGNRPYKHWQQNSPHLLLIRDRVGGRAVHLIGSMVCIATSHSSLLPSVIGLMAPLHSVLKVWVHGLDGHVWHSWIYFQCRTPSPCPSS